jgi:hypothetical protein
LDFVIVDVSDNKIAVIPSCIVFLSKLKELSVAGNPIQAPAPRVWKAGMNAIMDHFGGQKKGMSASDHVTCGIYLHH